MRLGGCWDCEPFRGLARYDVNVSGIAAARELAALKLINKLKVYNMQNSSEKHVSTGGSNTILPAVFSQDYLEWVNQANLPPLTNTQHKFAEWLLFEDNAKIIAQIGDLDTIFISVRKWLKNGR